LIRSATRRRADDPEATASTGPTTPG
jgi:hypothetical protein